MPIPGPLPPPPPDFHRHDLPITIFDRAWLRLHRTGFDAAFFDRRIGSRFNAVDGSFGVLYAGDSLACCIVETLLRLDTPAHTTFRTLSERDLATRSLTAVSAARPLRLVDLTGPHPATISADSRLWSGNHEDAAPWAHALWAHAAKADGLYFPARHDSDLRSVALFDRVDSLITCHDTVALLAVPRAELAQVLDRYAIALRP